MINNSQQHAAFGGIINQRQQANVQNFQESSEATLSGDGSAASLRQGRDVNNTSQAYASIAQSDAVKDQIEQLKLRKAQGNDNPSAG